MGEGNEFYTEWTESFDSFDQMNLHENLLRGIYAYGEYQHDHLELMYIYKYMHNALVHLQCPQTHF